MLGERRADLAAIALLLALPLVLFWRTLSGTMVVAGYDLILYSYPYRVATARAVTHGQFPFWNPDLFGGVPFLANIQAAVLYPFNLLFIWPGGPQLLSWSIIVHLALAGIFLFAFARAALRLSPAPAALAAVAFAASGFAIAQSEHLNQIDALPWVPALLLAFDRAYVTRRPAWSAALAVMLALQIFAGHPQDVYYGLLLLALWAVVLLLRSRAAGARSMFLPLLSPLIGLAAGVLLSAVQLLPTVELTRYSIRSGGLPWSEATAFSLPGRGVLGNLLPDYTAGLYTEWAGYIGLLATVLAVFAVIRRWRDPAVAVLALAALLALLFALGPLTPVFWLGYHLLPGVASFRVPARALLVSTVAGSLLAGVGAAELLRLLGERRWRAALWPAGLAFLLLLLEAGGYALQHLRPHLSLLKVFQTPIPGRQLVIWLVIVLALAGGTLTLRGRRRVWMSLLLPAIAAVEMVLAAQPLNPLHALPASIYQPNTTLDSGLPSDTSPYRSLSLAGLTDQQLNGGLSDPRFRAYTARRGIDQPDFAMQVGRATLDGYDGGILPLASYVRFRSLLLPPGTTNVPDYPLIVETDQVVRPDLLALLGVSRILVQATAVAPPGSSLAPARVIGSVLVLENPSALPRAFLIHDVQASQGSQQDLSRLASAALNPLSQAIASQPCAGQPSSGADRVQLTANSENALEVSVSSDSPGLLVVSNADYPGWQAQVDGHAAPVVQVDDFLQGVCLAPGTHRVQLAFTPTGWPLAIGLSLLGLLLVLYLGVAGNLRRRLALQLTHDRRQRRDHLADEALS